MCSEEKRLLEELSKIKGLELSAAQAARERQDALAKPPRSLGRLEDISVQIAGITGKTVNKIEKKRLLVLCADNGVVSEGVSSAPKSVTLAQAVNLTKGLTGAAVLSAHFGAELTVVDVGIDAQQTCPEILDRKLMRGTNNIAREPAMTRQCCARAVLTGIELARTAADEGADILGVGEMGIGNTTSSAAVLKCLTGLPARELVGRGGGVDDKGFKRKLEIVSDCAKKLSVNCGDVLDVLSKAGGLDLAAMTGVFLGAALCRLPVVIDGFISAAAALCAFRLCPKAREFMIASHRSCEAGYEAAMAELRLLPMLELDMRLGEGSGCPMAFEIVCAACAIMEHMASFEGAGIDDGYLKDIRENPDFTDGGCR